jgi:hypothetical protein
LLPGISQLVSTKFVSFRRVIEGALVKSNWRGKNWILNKTHFTIQIMFWMKEWVSVNNQAALRPRNLWWTLTDYGFSRRCFKLRASVRLVDHLHEAHLAGVVEMHGGATRANLGMSSGDFNDGAHIRPPKRQIQFTCENLPSPKESDVRQSPFIYLKCFFVCGIFFLSKFYASVPMYFVLESWAARD